MPTTQKLKQETPPAVLKPHIDLDNAPASMGLEVLKWLFFFLLFAVTAAIAFFLF